MYLQVTLVDTERHSDADNSEKTVACLEIVVGKDIHRT